MDVKINKVRAKRSSKYVDWSCNLPCFIQVSYPLSLSLYDILGSDCCKAKAILAIFIVCPVNNLKLLLSHLTRGYVSRVLLKRTKQLKNLHRVLIRIFKYRLNLSPYYVTVYQDFKSLLKASRKQDLNNTVQRNLGKFAVIGTAQKVFE